MASLRAKIGRKGNWFDITQNNRDEENCLTFYMDEEGSFLLERYLGKETYEYALETGIYYLDYSHKANHRLRAGGYVYK